MKLSELEQEYVRSFLASMKSDLLEQCRLFVELWHQMFDPEHYQPYQIISWYTFENNEIVMHNMVVNVAESSFHNCRDRIISNVNSKLNHIMGAHYTDIFLGPKLIWDENNRIHRSLKRIEEIYNKHRYQEYPEKTNISSLL